MKRAIRHHVIFPIFTLLLSAGPLLQAQSQLIDQFEFEMALNDIAFRNSLEGYAIADSILWKTTDGGSTWNKSTPLESLPAFTSIGLIGERGLIIGDMEGGVHRTAHLDSTWQSVVPGQKERIMEIGVIDENRWIVAAAYTLFLTEDGGRTYRALDHTPEVAFLGVNVTGSSVIHAFEPFNLVWRSTDAGATWNMLSTSKWTFGHLHDIFFISPDTGFVASWYPWSLYATHDGGKTWKTSGHEYPISIAVSDHGPAAYTTRSYIRTSDDRGRTWKDSIPLPQLLINGMPASPYHWTDHKVVAAGENGIALLLINRDVNRSMIARIDVPSGIREGGPVRPDVLDLSESFPAGSQGLGR